MDEIVYVLGAGFNKAIKDWRGFTPPLLNDVFKVAFELGKFSKDYGLKDQIQRAIISVSSNIVEGFEKNNNNEFIRYLKIAKGSCGEVRNQMYIAQTIEYISEKEFEDLNQKLLTLSSKIGCLIKYLEKTRKKNKLATL